MKTIILVIVCFGSIGISGLLRLHNGQIQQQMENGKWQCVNDEIRTIMNDGTVPWEYDNDGDVWIMPTSKSNTMEISGKGQFVMEYRNELDPFEEKMLCWIEQNDPNVIHVSDPNRMNIDDEFIRCLAKRGRICEVIGHCWHWTVCSDDVKCEICGRKIMLKGL